MGQAVLNVGGRRYELSCRDGEEAHVEALGRLVDAKATQAARSVGGVNEARQLLLAALLLADELGEAQAGRPPAPESGLAPAIEALAARIEALAARLEKAGDRS